MIERSAGFIVVHDQNFLLLQYEKGYWDFAKGHVEKGETDSEAALRELKEETGLQGEPVVGFKQELRYFFKRAGKTVVKDVIFFIATVRTADVKLSDEHVNFIWLPYAKAMKQVTYASAKEVLQKANEWLSEQDVKKEVC